MEEVPIRCWGFIPVDTDPTTGAPVELRPPMFTAMAMDRDASIVFGFHTSPGTLDLSVEATALSGGDRGPHLFLLYTGPATNSYRALTTPVWESTHEGMFTVFRTRAADIQGFLKISFDEARSIVLNRIEFHCP